MARDLLCSPANNEASHLMAGKHLHRQREFAVRFPVAPGLTLLSAPFVTEAQTTHVTCSAASLSGTYFLSLNGRPVSGAVFTKDYQATGTIVFDGAGTVTAALISNIGPAFGVSQKFAGTYTIPPSRIGALNFNSGDTASYTLIPHRSGTNIIMVGQDATYRKMALEWDRQSLYSAYALFLFSPRFTHEHPDKVTAWIDREAAHPSGPEDAKSLSSELT
jgi:hypothetical protein